MIRQNQAESCPHLTARTANGIGAPPCRILPVNIFGSIRQASPKSSKYRPFPVCSTGRPKSCYNPPMDLPEDISPEMELVLLCVRGALRALRAERRTDDRGRTTEEREELQDRTPQLAEGVDWQEVIRLARRHRVIPLVYRGLEEAVRRHPTGEVRTSRASVVRGLSSLAQVRQHLRKLYYSNLARNIRLTEEMLRILKMFEHAGIKAIPVKGPALAVQAYGDLSLRQFDDLDFLLRLEDMMSAGDILKANGYKPRLDMAPPLMGRYLKSGLDWPFRSRESKISIDLGSAIVSHVLPQPFTVDELSERLDTVTVEDHVLRTPGPEDSLLILCLHGSHHGWERLAWLADVTALIKTAGPDISSVTQKARKAGLQHILSLPLVLADRLGIGSLPDPPPSGLATHKVIPMCLRALADKLPTPVLWSFQMRSLERTSDKVRFALRRLFVPSVAEWQTISLPPALLPLHSLFRPLRLLFTFVRRLTVR